MIAFYETIVKCGETGRPLPETMEDIFETSLGTRPLSQLL